MRLAAPPGTSAGMVASGCKGWSREAADSHGAGEWGHAGQHQRRCDGRDLVEDDELVEVHDMEDSGGGGYLSERRPRAGGAWDPCCGGREVAALVEPCPQCPLVSGFSPRKTAARRTPQRQLPRLQQPGLPEDRLVRNETRTVVWFTASCILVGYSVCAASSCSAKASGNLLRNNFQDAYAHPLRASAFRRDATPAAGVLIRTRLCLRSGLHPGAGRHTEEVVALERNKPNEGMCAGETADRCRAQRTH